MSPVGGGVAPQPSGRTAQKRQEEVQLQPEERAQGQGHQREPARPARPVEAVEAEARRRQAERWNLNLRHLKAG